MTSPATAFHAPPPARVHRNLGFLMTALFVLLLLSASLSPGVCPSVAELIKNNPELEKYSRVTAELNSLKAALLSYKITTSVVPTTEQGLRALEAMPTTPPIPTRYRRIMGRLLKDPWNHEFQYRSPAEHSAFAYDLWSSGPDGVSGTPDDIGNWKQPTAR